MLPTILNVLVILPGFIALIIIAASKPLICGSIYAAGLLSAFLPLLRRLASAVSSRSPWLE